MRPDHASAIRARLVDPAALCVALGLPTVPQSRGVVARCPWHDDEHPSCSVRVAGDGTIAVHCHACGATGDALSLVAEVRGLDLRIDFPAVLAEAAALCNYDLGSTPARRTRARRDPVVDIAARIDRSADAWLAGRDVRRDPQIESATWAQIHDAMAVLGDARELERAADAEMDAAYAAHLELERSQTEAL